MQNRESSDWDWNKSVYTIYNTMEICLFLFFWLKTSWKLNGDHFVHRNCFQFNFTLNFFKFNKAELLTFQKALNYVYQKKNVIKTFIGAPEQIGKENVW